MTISFSSSFFVAVITLPIVWLELIIIIIRADRAWKIRDISKLVEGHVNKRCGMAKYFGDPTEDLNEINANGKYHKRRDNSIFTSPDHYKLPECTFCSTGSIQLFLHSDEISLCLKYWKARNNRHLGKFDFFETKTSDSRDYYCFCFFFWRIGFLQAWVYYDCVLFYGKNGFLLFF